MADDAPLSKDRSTSGVIVRPQSGIPQRVCIVVPAYNDWESLQILLRNLAVVGTANNLRFHVVVVDDSSSTSAPEHWVGVENSAIESLRIVRLACNMGHQRAIAVGLVVANEAAHRCTATVVMDGDGEDRPDDVPTLLATSAAHPGAVVCARRARRSEPLLFRLFYRVYKGLFAGLTGVRIDFGNFCGIPNTVLGRVVSQPGIWNHLAATLTRSRVPLVRLATIRGERYAGQPKMNFISLVIHGLSAVSVYADVALVRVMFMALVLAACSLTGIIVIAAIRFLTDLAIPGWASSVTGTLLGLFFQAIITPAIGVFVVLSLRTSRVVVPAKDAMDFVESSRLEYGSDESS